jgi:enterochelin esterase-like enzyme
MQRAIFVFMTATACLLSQGPTGKAVDDGIHKGLASTVWVNPPKPGQLPSGVTHHTYFSQSMKHDVGYCIYLPPGYATSGKRYPVIYNLHGAGGNELHSFEEAALLDEGIRAGKLPPMILVLPNGGKSTMYKDSYDGKFMGETNIIRELIPHVDATYRTIPRREGRCIQGFSMGGKGAVSFAMKFPEMFCSLFVQAGNVFHVSELWDPTRPDEYPYNHLGPDRAKSVENDPYLLLQKNLDQIKGKLRIQILCGTQDSHHLATIREFHAALEKAGVDHTYLEIEGLAHDLEKMIRQYRTSWFDYHVESLRRSGALPPQ